MERLLGYEIETTKEKDLKTFDLNKDITSERIVPDMYYSDQGGLSSVSYDLSTTPSDELALIKSYRELATYAEVDEALQEIRNEIFIFDVPDKKAIELDFVSGTELSEKLREAIIEEYDYLYKLMDFDRTGVQWFDDWYVDSKLYVHKMVDPKRPRLGIQKLETIDPLKIRKVHIVPMPNPDGTFDRTKIKELYVYSNKFDHQNQPLNQVMQIQYGSNIQGIQIRPEAITYVNSGRFDRNLGRYVGYLKKAIVPVNNLKMMEDAMVIFRVVRAPARRAWYVDVSGLQKNKADAYMKTMQARFKNKMVYNSATGTLSDRRNIQSMIEDYWLPRRDGAKGTEISTIEGQNNQEIMEEIEYLRDKVWRALGVPRGRFGDQAAPLQFGKSAEIQRDEYRFTKFLAHLRSQFVFLFEDILRTHLILKNIIRADEWETISRDISWQYAEDNAFVEYKESEIINNRLQTLQQIEPYVGKYFSREYVAKTILRMTDEEIAHEKKLIEKERPEELKRKKEEYDVQNQED